MDESVRDAGCTTTLVGLRKGSKGFASLADQNNTKQLAAVQAGLNHFPVTGFKDVKFKRHARKQDGVQWKSGNFMVLPCDFTSPDQQFEMVVEPLIHVCQQCLGELLIFQLDRPFNQPAGCLPAVESQFPSQLGNFMRFRHALMPPERKAPPAAVRRCSFKLCTSNDPCQQTGMTRLAGIAEGSVLPVG